MSEELQENDGTWSGLKKIIVGAIGTIITAGAVWVSTILFGGHEEKEPEKIQTPNIIINNQQNNIPTPEKTIIIKEKAATGKVPPKKDTGWEKKEPQW